MDKDTTKLLLYVGVGVGAVYLLSKIWSSVSSAVASATDPATTALANWYVQLTSGGQLIPTGMVMLPSGQAIAVADIPGGVQNVSGTNSAMFVYGGQTYYLNSPHDSNGNWAASTTLTGSGSTSNTAINTASNSSTDIIGGTVTGSW